MIRTNSDICLLCEKNLALKQNSHIISKFFRHRLIPISGPKNFKQDLHNGNAFNIQDLPKESYLFCHECEKKFEILETYCAHQFFNKIHIIPRKVEEFSLHQIIIEDALLRYLECRALNGHIFNLFIKSLIWRASVSNQIAFKKFKVSDTEETSLKVELQNNLKSTLNELLEHTKGLANIQTSVRGNSSFLILTKLYIGETPEAPISAYNKNSHLAVLHLADFILFYSTSNELPFALKFVENFNDGKAIKICIVNPETWELYNSIFKL